MEAKKSEWVDFIFEEGNCFFFFFTTTIITTQGDTKVPSIPHTQTHTLNSRFIPLRSRFPAFPLACLLAWLAGLGWFGAAFFLLHFHFPPNGSTLLLLLLLLSRQCCAFVRPLASESARAQVKTKSGRLREVGEWLKVGEEEEEEEKGRDGWGTWGTLIPLPPLLPSHSLCVCVCMCVNATPPFFSIPFWIFSSPVSLAIAPLSFPPFFLRTLGGDNNGNSDDSLTLVQAVCYARLYRLSSNLFTNGSAWPRLLPLPLLLPP